MVGVLQKIKGHAKDFDQAIEWANSTRFALTGGIFSRSPEHLSRARRDFRVGTLYINRNNTGALVERQPFGGSPFVNFQPPASRLGLRLG